MHAMECGWDHRLEANINMIIHHRRRKRRRYLFRVCQRTAKRPNDAVEWTALFGSEKCSALINPLLSGGANGLKQLIRLLLIFFGQ